MRGLRCVVVVSYVFVYVAVRYVAVGSVGALCTCFAVCVSPVSCVYVAAGSGWCILCTCFVVCVSLLSCVYVAVWSG